MINDTSNVISFEKLTITPKNNTNNTNTNNTNTNTNTTISTDYSSTNKNDTTTSSSIIDISDSTCNEISEKDENINDTLLIEKHRKKKKKKSKMQTIVLNEACFHESRGIIVQMSSQHSIGRHLSSTRVIHENETFFSENPIAILNHIHMNNYNSKGICSVCHQIINNSSTTISRIIDKELLYDWFCSSECHTLGKKYFINEMSCMSDIAKVAMDNDCDVNMLRMILRVFSFIYKTQDDDQTSKLFTDDGVSISSTLHGLNSLEAHLDWQSKEWCHHIENALIVLLSKLSKDFQYQLREILSKDLIEYGLFIAACLNTNAYGIEDEDGNDIGIGLFPAVGLCINHSCFPNCHRRYRHGKLEFYTLQEIKKNEELTVAYIDILQSTPNRRRMIQSSRYFHCLCSRCQGYDKKTSLNELSPHGIYCHTCGQGDDNNKDKGVIVVEEALKIASCIQCKSLIDVEQGIKYMQHEQYSFDMCLSIIKSPSNPISTKMTYIERYLDEFDRQFTLTYSLPSKQPINEIISRRKYQQRLQLASLFLLPNHIHLLFIQRSLCDLLEITCDNVNDYSTLDFIVSLRRSISERCDKIFPRNYPEANIIHRELLHSIDKLSIATSQLKSKKDKGFNERSFKNLLDEKKLSWRLNR